MQSNVALYVASIEALLHSRCRQCYCTRASRSCNNTVDNARAITLQSTQYRVQYYFWCIRASTNSMNAKAVSANSVNAKVVRANIMSAKVVRANAMKANVVSAKYCKSQSGERQSYERQSCERPKSCF